MIYTITIILNLELRCLNIPKYITFANNLLSHINVVVLLKLIKRNKHQGKNLRNTK